MDRRTFVRNSVLLTLAGGIWRATPAYAGTPIPQGLPAGGGGFDAPPRTVVTEHPRLLLRDFDGVRATIAGSPRAAAWYAKVKADADTILGLPVSEYRIPDGLRLLDTSREVVRRSYSLALTHALEGEARYADRLFDEMRAVAAFPDWNSQRHFLDTAEMTHAVALAYDWLYEHWSTDQRATMRTAIREYGLKPGLAVYAKGSDWPTQTNNWNIVCNAGLSLGALALAQDETEIAAQVLDHALASIPIAIAAYAPDGGYPEGLGSYWGYATKYLVPFLASLRTATGDDHGFLDAPGLGATGLFPIHLTGPTGTNFDYYDAGAGTPRPPEMLWLASTYRQPVFGWWGAQGADANPVSWSQSPAGLIWYDPSQDLDPIAAELPYDHYFRRCEVVTLRSGWLDPGAAWVGFKGGDNTTNHGDLDLGDFVFEAAGVRWADELGSDDYNMPGYFSGGPGGQRWTYYRKRAEGQNTLVVNPAGVEDQKVQAVGTITAHASGPLQAYAIADLTAAAPALSSWRRGVRLYDARQQLVVQDEFACVEGETADAWWFLHTPCAISVASDGRSAVLERSGQRLLARVVSPSDATFCNAAAKPLWTSPDPAEQAAITGVRKLAVRLRGVSSVRVAVQLSPLRAGEPSPPVDPVVPLQDWETGPRAVARLSALTLDRQPLQGFSPDNFVPTVRLSASAPMPTIAATPESPQGKAIVHPARTLPGVATIDVTAPGAARGRYRIVLEREIGPGHFPSTIVASADDGNIPANTVDGNFDTRWSADGDGQWIGYDLGADGAVSSVRIAWYQGDQRSSRFDVEVAASSETLWRKVFSGASSGTSKALETYAFASTTARYVRIVGHGNSASSWNSITEVEIPGRTITLPPVSSYLAKLTLHGPDSLPLKGSARYSVTGTTNTGGSADLSNATLEFYAGDGSVARIDASGELTAIAEGTVDVAGIVLTQGDRRLEYDRRTLTVTDPNVQRSKASADTYVNDGGSSGVNYGTSTTLLVKQTGTPDSGFDRQAYLRFDPAAVPDGRSVAAVTLRLYASVQDTQGTETDLAIHRLTAAFDERTTTWDNRPALGERLATVHVTTGFDWREVDLTAALGPVLGGGGGSSGPVELGVVEAPAAGQVGLATQIRSRETAQPPTLVVRLDPAG